jgi:hypothetical protein
MSDECLVILDKWIITQKNNIYDEHVKGDNDANELQGYCNSLEEFADRLIQLIEKELFSELKTLGWPEELMECIKEIGIRVDIIHHIDSWLIRYPFNRSKMHNKELEREKEGLQ